LSQKKQFECLTASCSSSTLWNRRRKMPGCRDVVCIKGEGKGKGGVWLLMELHLTAKECHLPYGITAPRHKWTHTTLTPARLAGTWFTYPGGMESWVDLGDRLRTEVVYPLTLSIVFHTSVTSCDINITIAVTVLCDMSRYNIGATTRGTVPLNFLNAGTTNGLVPSNFW